MTSVAGRGRGYAGTRARVGADAAAGYAGTRVRARAEPIEPAERKRLAEGFGAELRALHRDVPQGAAAARAGVSLRWLVALENGRGRPTREMCRRLVAGWLPDVSRRVQAQVEVRLWRLAGESLRERDRQRPMRPADRRLYAEAERWADEHPPPPSAKQEWMDAVNAGLLGEP